MKKVKITLWGGFHDSPAVNILIPASAYKDLKEGAALWEVLSDAQFARLSRHFCGIKGCLCRGGVWSIMGKSITSLL